MLSNKMEKRTQFHYSSKILRITSYKNFKDFYLKVFLEENYKGAIHFSV